MSIIKKPIVTEKMTTQGEVYNRYAFVVDKRANKIDFAGLPKMPIRQKSVQKWS